MTAMSPLFCTFNRHLDHRGLSFSIPKLMEQAIICSYNKEARFVLHSRIVASVTNRRVGLSAPDSDLFPQFRGPPRGSLPALPFSKLGGHRPATRIEKPTAAVFTESHTRGYSMGTIGIDRRPSGGAQEVAMAVDQIIFVVDDDPRMRSSLTGLFDSMGIANMVFASAGEYVAAEKPDTI